MTFVRAALAAGIAMTLGGCLPIERIYTNSYDSESGKVRTTISRVRIDVERSRVLFVSETTQPELTLDTAGKFKPTGKDERVSLVQEFTNCKIVDRENWECDRRTPYTSKYSMIKGNLTEDDLTGERLFRSQFSLDF